MWLRAKRINLLLRRLLLLLSLLRLSFGNQSLNPRDSQSQFQSYRMSQRLPLWPARRLFLRLLRLLKQSPRTLGSVKLRLPPPLQP